MAQEDGSAATDTVQARQAWFAELSRAPFERLSAAWDAFEPKPEYTIVRGPEIGMVMIRARAGGTGGRFNFGEATVTRCSVQLATGELGHGYVLGRKPELARYAALFDALLQTTGHHFRVHRELIVPLARDRLASRERDARKAAATKVEFFTVVRGDD